MIYGAFLSIKYLKKLEIKTGRYHNYPNEDLPHEDTEIKEEDYEYDLGDDHNPFKSGSKYQSELLDKLKIIGEQEGRQLNII